MNSAQGTYDGAWCPDRRIERNLSDSEVGLQQALRTLRAIRQRYAIDRAMHPDQRCLTVHVALGYPDMCWITAAIEAVEKSIVAGTTEAAVAHEGKRLIPAER